MAKGTTTTTTTTTTTKGNALWQGHIYMVPQAGTKGVLALVACYQCHTKAQGNHYRVLVRVYQPGKPTTQGARSMHTTQADAQAAQGALVAALQGKGWVLRAQRQRATDTFAANALPAAPTK